MTALPIANHLRKMRFENREMTQARLASICGVTRQTIVALETGRYTPSLELAMKLAATLGCGLDDLFFWSDPAVGAEYRAKGLE